MICKNCGQDDTMHHGVDMVCPTSVFVSSSTTPPSSGGGPTPPAGALIWDWTKGGGSKLFQPSVGEDVATTIWFMPISTGLGEFRIAPTYADNRHPNGYEQTVCLSQTAGKVDEAPPYSASGVGAKLFFQLGGTFNGFAPLLSLNQWWTFNISLNPGSGGPHKLNIECYPAQ